MFLTLGCMQAFKGETASSLLLARGSQLSAILGYQVLKGAFPAASLHFSQSLPTSDMNGSQPLNVTVQALGSGSGSGTNVRPLTLSQHSLTSPANRVLAATGLPDNATHPVHSELVQTGWN